MPIQISSILKHINFGSYLYYELSPNLSPNSKSFNNTFYPQESLTV